MVARSPLEPGFSPVERPRIVVAADGTLAAIHEPSRISVVDLPTCSAFAELGMDSNAVACDVAWVGTPPRLLVLSRYEAHSTVHLVDPFGPRTIAEIRLETPMRLYAAVGAHALVIGPQGAAILAASEKNLTPYTFPARTVPLTAGAAGMQFMVALPGAIEEWDPQNRMPKRRLKLPRPATITAVGGSDRVVWMTTLQEPSRIEVIPLVNRGQPKAHELPEPIASVASHPRSDLIACIGATSGRVWVIDLDGRTGLRIVGPEGIDKPEAAGIVLGRVVGVIAAQANRPITVVPLERPEVEAEPPRAKAPSVPPPEKRSSLYDDDGHQGEEGPTSVTLATPGPATPPTAPPAFTAPVTAASPKPVARTPLPQFGVPIADAPPAATSVAPPVKAPLVAGGERQRALTAWRERMESPRARTAEPVASVWPNASATWREDLIAWARRLGTEEASDLPAGTPVESIVTRMELAAGLEPVVALAYAQHLLGQDGISALDVANVQRNFSGSWDEALGRGELATLGVAAFRSSRMRLSDLIVRVLDEHPPRTGILVGTPGIVSLLGPCVIVAAGPLSIIAEACLTSIGGAILAGNPDVDPRELAAEARPYGAAPMWRVRTEELGRVPADQPFILVAEDDATADQLGVPRLT